MSSSTGRACAADACALITASVPQIGGGRGDSERLTCYAAPLTLTLADPLTLDALVPVRSRDEYVYEDDSPSNSRSCEPLSPHAYGDGACTGQSSAVEGGAAVGLARPFMRRSVVTSAMPPWRVSSGGLGR